MRRQSTESTAVAVAETVDRPAENAPAPPVAVEDDGTRKAPAEAAPDTVVPQRSKQEPVEAEDDFGEEITEEEVQKELDQRCTEVAGSPARETGAGAAQTTEATPESQPPAEGQAVEPRRGGHTCPSCGSNVRLTDKFCIWCGERQPQRIVPKMKRCSECRTQLPMTANFCFVCGNDVSLHLRRKVKVPSELFHEEDPELFPTFEA